jgi:hypothetical protein
VRIGTTTVENLLRVARRDTAAGTAFAALGATGRASEIISVPEPGSAEGLSADELAELVRQASADPEFVHARVFVRSSRVGRALTLVVAPLRDGGGRGMIGLVAEPDHRFEAAHLEVLGQLADRLVRHLKVVQQLSSGGDPDAEAHAGPEADGGRGVDAGRGADTGRGVDVGCVVDAGRGADGVRGADAGRGVDAVRGAGGTHERLSIPRGPGGPVSEAPEFPLVSGTRLAADGQVFATPGHALAPGAGGGRPTREPQGEEAAAPTPGGLGAAPLVAPTPRALWWTERDRLTGLPGLGRFFSQAGRLLALESRSAGTFVLVVLEVPDDRAAQVAAGVLGGALRSTDPVGRVGRGLLAAALLLADGSGDAVEGRLGAAVRSALDGLEGVRTAHVAAAPGDVRDVDELLRDALISLRDRRDR